MRHAIVLALALAASVLPAVAQQSEQDAFFVKALTALQAQRNAAADEAANARARGDLLAEQVNALHAEIAKLKDDAKKAADEAKKATDEPSDPVK